MRTWRDKTAQELLNHLRDAQRAGVDLSQVFVHFENENSVGFSCDKHNHIEDFDVTPTEDLSA